MYVITHLLRLLESNFEILEFLFNDYYKIIILIVTLKKKKSKKVPIE